MSFGYRVLGFGAFPSRGVDSYVPTHAAVFNGSSDYLTWYFNEAGNTAKFTLSVWTKRSDPANTDIIFEARADGNNTGTLYFNTTDIHWQDYDDGVGTPAWRLNSDAMFRDPTAWMNIVAICDTSQDAPDARQRLFVNGVQLTSFSTNTNSSQGYESAQGILSTNPHYIGFDGNSNYFDGYMAELILLDGVAAEATTFGEYDSSTGIWVAKNPLAGYGADTQAKNISDWGGRNSLYLNFSDNNNLGKNFRPIEVTANPGTYKIDYSIYLDGSDDYLNFTPSSVGSRTDFTLSWWMKAVNADYGSTSYLFSVGDGTGNEEFGVAFLNSEILRIFSVSDGSTYQNFDYRTSQVFRDPTAWQHCVISFDHDNGVAGDRIRLWINGIEVADADFGTSTDPVSDELVYFTDDEAHNIGRTVQGSNYAPMYLAEIILLDGVSVTDPSNFGGWDANGIWQPVDPSGLTSMQGQVLIPQNTGSTIGTMNTRTSAAFDGNNNQDEYAAATHSSAASSVTIGKDFGSGNAKTVNQVKVWGYSGGGFTSNASATCTIAVIGSNTGLGSDEVTLFTSGTIADTTNANEQNFSFNNTTAYRYVYIKLTQSATNYFYVAELEFYNETTVGYGDNGFLLQFKGDGSTFDSNADAGGVGADTSNQNNHWTGNGSVHDNRTTDSPTNTSGDNEGNYATLNPLHQSAATLSGGNLTIAGTGSTSPNASAMSTMPLFDYAYFEVKMTQRSSASPNDGDRSAVIFAATDTAIGDIDVNLTSNSNISGVDNGFRPYTAGSAGTDPSLSWEAGQFGAFAIRADGSGGTNIFVAEGGVSNWIYGSGTTGNPTGNANPTLNISGSAPNELFVGGACYASTDKLTFNFGQTGFQYTPPTGFKGVNTANLTAPTVTDPRKYFAILLYKSTEETRTVRGCFDSTGTAWTPDFLWVKDRNNTTNFTIVDNVRGANSGIMFSSANVAEQTPTYDGVTAFIEGGFTVGHDASDYFNNPANRNYVAFALRAGGAPTVENDNTSGAMDDGSVFKGGTVQSSYTPSGSPSVYPTKMSIAEHGGFSIINWTGDGTNSDTTIPHGLDAAIEFVITKNRDLGTDWLVKHKDDGVSDGTNFRLNLSSSTTPAASGYLKAAGLTTHTFEFDEGDSNANNFRNNGERYLAYCFKRTPGLIGIGKYTGNNSANGTMVVVDDGASGFKPAWVMVKRTDATDSWHINDSGRDTFNPLDLQLQANSTGNESGTSYMDFIANGFKLRGTQGATNASGGNYIYLAFADQPFSLQSRAI